MSDPMDRETALRASASNSSHADSGDVKRLIKALETTAIGSRELSDRVLVTLGWEYDRRRASWWSPVGVNNIVHPCNRPNPTVNLNDAWALVPSDCDWLTGSGESWVWPKGGMAKGWRVSAATPPLSLCAALLRSREDDPHGR